MTLLLALTLLAAPVDHYATVNGLRIHYLDWGSEGKQPLIMLHGIGRVAHTFDHIAPHFAAKYHVIAVDMRGHGDSAWDPKGAYLVEDYTKDIEALAEQLHFTKRRDLGEFHGRPRRAGVCRNASRAGGGRHRRRCWS